jgi:glycerol-3-phosphate dehydrogenase subunit B
MSEFRYDVVVVGAGVAGLCAAVRLAEGGAHVCVLAHGVGSTHLAPGVVDVLGYTPERVEEPARALPAFVEAHPDHPYALIGVDAIGPALDWFAEHIAGGPQAAYSYVGGLERNLLLPTALGVARPSALVPETMARGVLDGGAPLCIVGVPRLRDLHASLCAANLSRLDNEARSVELDIGEGRAEVNALGLARQLDDPSYRNFVAGRLAPLLREGERVGMPAILGLRDPHGAWSDLEKRLGHELFEIPTLPPSAPGIRVYDALTAALRAAGGRLVLGARVVGSEREGARVTTLRTHAGGRDTVYEAERIVLASGGFASGGIELDSDWQTHERVLGLPLRGLPAPGEPRFRADYFGEQPIAKVGIAVDSEQRAEGTDNVLVAGAALPGAEPWREGSGEGIAITSAHRAAGLVLAEAGQAAAA